MRRWSRWGLAGGWGTIVMETVEIERNNWLDLRDQPEHQGGPGSQLKHFRREAPFQSTVVEALSMLDLRTGLNSGLDRDGVRGRGWGNASQYKQKNRRAQQRGTSPSYSGTFASRMPVVWQQHPPVLLNDLGPHSAQCGPGFLARYANLTHKMCVSFMKVHRRAGYFTPL